METLLTLLSTVFGIVGMIYTFLSNWFAEIKSMVLQDVVAFSMPIYLFFVFIVILHPSLKNLRLPRFIKFVVQGLVYGSLAWFTDEVGEKNPEPYMVVASSAWACHFGFAALRLKVYGDYGLAVGLVSLAILISIHLTSLSIVKLILMFGGGFLLAAISRLITWATKRKRRQPDCEQGEMTELETISGNRNSSHAAGNLRRTEPPEVDDHENSALPTHAHALALEEPETARMNNTNDEVERVVVKDAKRAAVVKKNPTPEDSEPQCETEIQQEIARQAQSETLDQQLRGKSFMLLPEKTIWTTSMLAEEQSRRWRKEKLQMRRTAFPTTAASGF